MAKSDKYMTLSFDSGHDLTVCGFELHIGLCAESSGPGACFRFCVSLCLSAPPHLCSVCLSLKNKYTLKKKRIEGYTHIANLQ